jgi:L-asparaginase
MQSLDNARKSGVIIVRSTRIPSGVVPRDKKLDDAHDFIAADSLNPQKAKILLQLALTKYSPKDTNEIQELFYKY